MPNSRNNIIQFSKSKIIPILMKVNLIGILILSISFFSCVNSKNLSYFQDLSDTSRVHQVELAPYEPLRLQPDDQLQINISSISPEASQFFNLLQATPNATIGTTGTQMFQNIYSVNQQGLISLPILGDIPVKGQTTEDLRIRLKVILKDYLKEAVVTVKLINFKVTVIGDVGHPMVVPVQGERINVLEALGAAGDMTAYGKRYNVKVVRQREGQFEFAHLNFNDSRTIKSPYFQLRQNDLVYVEPYKSKGFVTESWITLVPIVTSLLSLLVISLSYLTR
jgi:polysaccharide export outer membrane protein